jgi:hypothetical protein
MAPSTVLPPHTSGRPFLARVGGLGLTGQLGMPAWDAMAATPANLPFANGRRELVTNFPQKGAELLQRK